MAPVLGPFSLDRMVHAMELVRQRLLRATAALEAAGIPYAVAGGNAIALWVSRVDVSAVRNTSDVDLLVRRVDLDAIRAALASACFEYRHVAGLELFLDGPAGKARDGVRLIFDGEMVRPGECCRIPRSRSPWRGASIKCWVCKRWCRSSERPIGTRTERICGIYSKSAWSMRVGYNSTQRSWRIASVGPLRHVPGQAT
jgi:hypothetical protein